MLQIFFFVTLYITCKPSVQFYTFPHSVYKGTKTTDFNLNFSKTSPQKGIIVAV
jgi:hypothetical protein